MDFPGKSLSIRAKQRLLGGRGYSWDEDNDIWTAGEGVRDKEGMRERERERGRYLPTFFRDCTYFLCTGGRSSASRE